MKEINSFELIGITRNHGFLVLPNISDGYSSNYKKLRTLIIFMEGFRHVNPVQLLFCVVQFFCLEI